MNGNAEAGQKRKVEDTLWNSLADVCSDLTDSQSFQIRDKSSGSSGGLIDLSGSMLERKKYDFFDLDENDYIVLQPKIPIFPEDFPANKKEWPLSWWGIVDPKLLGEPPKKRKGKSNKSEKSATSNHGSRSRDKYQDAPPHDRYERRSEERFRRGPPPPPPRAELDRPGPPSDYRGPPPNFQGPRDKGPYPNDYQFDDERRRRPHDRVPPPRYRDDRRPQRYSHDRESPPPRWERGPPKNFDEDRNLPPRQMDDRGPPRPLDRSPPRYQDSQRDDMGPPHYPGDRHHHHHHHPPDDFQFRHHDDRGRNNGGNRGRGDWRQDDRGRNDRDDRKGRRPRRPDDRESRYR